MYSYSRAPAGVIIILSPSPIVLILLGSVSLHPLSLEPEQGRVKLLITCSEFRPGVEEKTALQGTKVLNDYLGLFVVVDKR